MRIAPSLPWRAGWSQSLKLPTLFILRENPAAAHIFAAPLRSLLTAPYGSHLMHGRPPQAQILSSEDYNNEEVFDVRDLGAPSTVRAQAQCGGSARDRDRGVSLPLSSRLDAHDAAGGGELPA